MPPAFYVAQIKFTTIIIALMHMSVDLVNLLMAVAALVHQDLSQ